MTHIRDSDGIALAEALLRPIVSKKRDPIWEFTAISGLLRQIDLAVQEIAADRALLLHAIRVPGEGPVSLAGRVPGLTRERASDLLEAADRIVAEERQG